MSKALNSGRYAPEGARVPTALLPNAIRWEAARAQLFHIFGRFDESEHCIKLMQFYQQRAMDETAEDYLDPGPT